MRKLKLFSLIVCALFATQMWADTFSAAEIATNPAGGTKKSHVTCSSGKTTTTNKKVKNVSNIACVAIGNTVDTATNTSTDWIQIQADENYTLDNTITIQGASNSGDDKNIAVLMWLGDYDPTSADTCYTAVAPENDSGTRDNIALSFPSGRFRTIRMYRRINYKNGTIGKDANGSSYQQPSSNNGSFNIQSITVSATASTSYTITYNVNGGSGDPMANSTNIVSACTYTAPSGKAFYEWNSLANGQGDSYAPGDEVESNVDLYAIWKEIYAITYNAGTSGSGTIAAGNKFKGVVYTLSSKTFTREGYAQIGWTLTDGGAKAYDLGGSYTTDAAQTFYPVWTVAATYTFDATNAKSIATLQTEGWTFNSTVFDADPADTEAYVNTVDAMNTAGLTAPNDNSMNANAIAFAKNTDAYAQFDLGYATNVYAISGDFCIGSNKDRTFDIVYIGADGSTVLKTITINHNKTNWGKNSVNNKEEVSNVRYIKVKSVAEKSWLVMENISITYLPKYAISCADAENGSVEADKSLAAAGETVTLTLHPDPNYKVATVKVNGGDALEVTNNEATFTMSAEAANVVATFKVAYSIELAKGSEAKTVGAAIIGVDDTELTIITAPTGTGTLQGFYTEGGTKVADKDGKLVAGDVDGYVTGGKWSLADEATLYAVYDGIPTALDNTNASAKTVKRLENGMLVIEKNGVRYNAMGQTIR